MMHSNVLFFPIMFACTSNNDYKKIQEPFSSFAESSKVVDVISDVYGLKDIDAPILPVMQLYNPADFHKRDIDLWLECLAEDSYKNIKKANKYVPISNVMILYNSTGIWPDVQMQPEFKPLSEVPNVCHMVENGDISEGEAAILYLMLPIVILHNNSRKLDKIVESIVYNETVDETGMEKIGKAINGHYGFKDTTLNVFRIGDVDFLGDEFAIIQETIGETMLECGYVKTPIMKDPKIGRNELCPCGSGKKYKQCCISKLN